MPKNKTKTPEQKEPPKGWSIDTSAIKDKHTGNLTDTEKQNYHNFVNRVASGEHPKEAAKNGGDMNYKKFASRSSEGHHLRCYRKSDDDTEST
jgi:hypothetical protein